MTKLYRRRGMRSQWNYCTLTAYGEVLFSSCIDSKCSFINARKITNFCGTTSTYMSVSSICDLRKKNGTTILFINHSSSCQYVLYSMTTSLSNWVPLKVTLCNPYIQYGRRRIFKGETQQLDYKYMSLLLWKYCFRA